VVVILAVLVNPVFAARKDNVSAQKAVTASAVVVPAQVSELGFLIAGIARDVPVREGDIVKAGQTLLVLNTPDLQFAVDAARANVRAAQAEEELRRDEIIKKYRINYKSFTVHKFRLSVPHEEIEIANARIEKARAAVDMARANLAQGTLRAPYDGTIAALKVIPGEFVPSNQAVLTLATLDTLQIETTDLSEREIATVHIGNPVNVFIEALNTNIRGKVIGVSPIANTVGGDVVFKVTIALDEQPTGLLWGMTAKVEIKSGE
jgi:HlyD family secretion protein